MQYMALFVAPNRVQHGLGVATTEQTKTQRHLKNSGFRFCFEICLKCKIKCKNANDCTLRVAL